MSYWVALLFTLGSAAWIVNGWFLFLPSGNADLDLNASGWSGAAFTPLGNRGRQAGVLHCACLWSLSERMLHSAGNGMLKCQAACILSSSKCLILLHLYDNIEAHGGTYRVFSVPQHWWVARCSQSAHTWALSRPSTLTKRSSLGITYAQHPTAFASGM